MTRFTCEIVSNDNIEGSAGKACHRYRLKEPPLEDVLRIPKTLKDHLQARTLTILFVMVFLEMGAIPIDSK